MENEQLAKDVGGVMASGWQQQRKQMVVNVAHNHLLPALPAFEADRYWT